MMKPPLTKTFPRLASSTWDSYYTTADGARVVAPLELSGDRGTYRPQGNNVVGRLANVAYEPESGGAINISGRWFYGSSSGHFRFRVAPDDLSAFRGEWGFGRGETEGIWDGARTSR